MIEQKIIGDKLTENELAKTIGGSNDGFWYGVGKAAGTATNAYREVAVATGAWIYTRFH